MRLTELKPFASPLTPQQPLPSVFPSPESRVISKRFFLFGKDRTFLLHPLRAKTCCFLAPALEHGGTEGFQSSSFGWQRRFRCGPGTARIRRLRSPCQPTALSACCWDLLLPPWDCSHPWEMIFGGASPLFCKRLGTRTATIQAVPASTFRRLPETACPTSAAGKEQQHSQGLFVPEDLKREGLSPPLQIQLSPVAEEPARPWHTWILLQLKARRSQSHPGGT